MHRCAVCGTTGAVELTTVSGKHLGWSCQGQCQALLWQSAFLEATGATEDEHALVVWEWRRRRCQVRGEPLPSRPLSVSERTINAWIRAHGLEDIAEELA
jgi:hypothetical protein